MEGSSGIAWNVESALANLFRPEQPYCNLVQHHISPELPLRDQLSLSRVCKLWYHLMKNRPFCPAVHKEACLLPRQSRGVTAVAAHPSLPLVAFDTQGGITIWSLATRGLHRTLSSDVSYRADVITWSPDGKCLATGGWTHGIAIWSLETGNIEQTYESDNGDFSLPAWSPDGRFIALVQSTGKIHVWPTDKETSSVALSAKPREGERNYVVNGLSLPEGGLPSSWIDGGLCKEEYPPKWSTVASTSDGKYTALGSSSGEIRIWKWETRQLSQHIRDDQHPITALAFSTRGEYLASGSRLGVVTIWSVTTGQPREKFQGFSRIVNSLCWSFDNRFIIGCGSAGVQMRIWMVENSPIESSWEPVLSCSPNGQKFIARNGLGCLVIKSKQFDCRNWILHNTEDHRVINGCWRADSAAFITFVAKAGFYLWSTETGKSTLVAWYQSDDLTAVEWNPNGETFAAAFGDGRPGAKVISAQTGETAGSIYGHANSGPDSGTRCIAYNPSLTDSCASGGWQRRVYLWDSKSTGYSTMRSNTTDTIDEPSVDALKWTDSTHLSIGRRGAHIRYDVTNRTSTPLGGHYDGLTCFALSPDGKQIASAGRDSLVVVWDLEANFEGYPIAGFPGAIEEVVWSSASEIIGRGANGHIAVWKWDRQTSQAVMRWCSSPLRFDFLQPVDTKVIAALA